MCDNIIEEGDLVGKIYDILLSIRYSKAFRIICKAIVVAVLSIAFAYAAGQYSVCISNGLNLPVFVLVFLCIPTGLMGLARRKKWIGRWAWIAVVLVVIGSLWQYGSKISLVHTAPEHYLQENSAFTQAAAKVFPDKADLASVERVVYYHEKAVFSPFEIIELTVYHSDENFAQESEATKTRISLLEQTWAGFPYYFAKDTEGLCLHGHEYMAYTFSVEGVYYAAAYSLCAETRAIRFLFFTNDILSSMSVYDALMAVEYQWNSCT
jgi:hypothetical protein